MNVQDAARRICTLKGTKKVAHLIGMNSDLLKAKLTISNERNKLSLDEAVLIQSATGEADILHAMAEELGYAVIPLPVYNAPSRPQAISKACAEFGDFMRKADEVFDDGEVTPNEAKALEKELTEMIAAATRLHSVLVGKGANK
jgi:hypothetical protein